ncbi:transposable element Hobo transposase-like protein, partial [Leptotrombidium deliense]
ILGCVPTIALTAALWKKRGLDTNYLPLTAHFYVEEDDYWRKSNRVLATREIIGTKTAENLNSIMECILRDYQADRLLVPRETIIVTDNGANMKKACRLYNWVSCAAQNVQLALENAFGDIEKEVHRQVNDENDEAADVSNPLKVVQLLAAVKRVVQYLKKSNSISKLSKRIPQSCCTRWNSLYDELAAFSEQEKQNEEIIVDRETKRLFFSIDFNLLKTLLSLLKVFKDVTQLLSPENDPTIHLVPNSKNVLLQNYSHDGEQSGSIENLKSRLYQLVEKHIQIQDIHLAAALLWPCQRNVMTFKTEEYLKKAKTAFKELISTFRFLEKNANDQIETTVSQGASVPQIFRDFVSLEVTACPSRMTATEELDYYLNETFSSPGRDIVSSFAKHIRHVPVTETASERNFSDAGKSIEGQAKTNSTVARG